MATSKTSEAKAKIGLDSASFEKGAKAVISAANQMSEAVTVAFAAAGVAILAVMGAKGVSSILDSAKGVLDLGESMANAGKSAGIAAGQFYLFNAAVEKGLSMKTVAGLIGDNAEVLNKSANIFRDVSIKLWAIGEKIRGFWLGLMDRVAPVLSRILDGALGASLVSAGEWFGEKISDAVEIVYQLAKDGNLWSTLKTGLEIAFNYAGERVLWLGKLILEVLKVSTSAAFTWGVNEAVHGAFKAMGELATVTGTNLAIAFANGFMTIVEVVDGLVDRVQKAFLKFASVVLGTSSSGKDTESKASSYLANTIAALTATLGNSTKGNSESFSETIGRAIKSVTPEFKQSESLGDSITKFTETIASALPGYNKGEKDNPTTHFENNTRRAAFGADSLTSIGGGGGVSLGLSVLDVNKSQLKELQRINEHLGSPRNSSSYTNPIYESQGYFSQVSRTQTSSPVQGVSNADAH